MGYSLLGGKNRDFFTSLILYPNLLRLAFFYGWEPQGTELDVTVECSLSQHSAKEAADSRRNWDRLDYTTNSFQRVTDEDARAIAASLDRALSEIPDQVVTNVLLSGTLMLAQGREGELGAARIESPDHIIIAGQRAYLPDGTVLPAEELEKQRSEFLDTREGMLTYFSGGGGRQLVQSFAHFARTGGYYTT
jgi:hypothetical protein